VLCCFMRVISCSLTLTNPPRYRVLRDRELLGICAMKFCNMLQSNCIKVGSTSVCEGQAHLCARKLARGEGYCECTLI
jgi:hypothetical protein